MPPPSLARGFLPLLRHHRRRSIGLPQQHINNITR
jgi:hypothetical protein